MVIHNNMELKVWVDNIKRVVCGVTDNTTCQDIVIALAQAMGRTGRFTLIEKWRDNERPLAPNECPLIVLQKWGEFANEVSLVLYESGSRRKQKTVEKETNDVQKPQDRFTHNFTPPVKTSEAVIRRSLTFSGIRKPETGNYRKPDSSDYQVMPTAGVAGRLDRTSVRAMADGGHLNSTAVPASDRVSRAPMPLSERNSRVPGPRSASASRVRSLSHDRNHPSNHPLPQPHDRYHPSNHPSTQSNDRYHQSNQPHPPSIMQNPPPYSHVISNHTQRQPSPLQRHPSPQQRQPSPQQNPQYDPHYQPSQPQPPSKPMQYNQPYASQQRQGRHTPNNIQSMNQNYSQQQMSDDRTQTGSISNRPMSNGPMSNGPMTNGPTLRSSAFKPVYTHHSNTEADKDSMKVQNSDISVFGDKVRTSHKQDMEEYDLDSNFPDVVKETGRDFLIEEYQMPGVRSGQSQVNGNHGYRESAEEQERVKLLRLVTMQNERIKMQDSQLDIIDTEITSREEKLEDTKVKLSEILDEIENLSGKLDDQGNEMIMLDNGTLIDEMEKEKHAEKDIKNEISALKGRLEKCENDLHQFHTKVKLCGEDLEKEREAQEADEARRQSVETELEKEISELKHQMIELDKSVSDRKLKSEDVEEELEEVQKQVTDKTDTLTTLEKDLQRENLKFFQEPVKQSRGSTGSTGSTSSQKSIESNGEAVLKVLEGSPSPHLKRAKMAAASPLNLLSISKNKNGIWV